MGSGPHKSTRSTTRTKLGGAPEIAEPSPSLSDAAATERPSQPPSDSESEDAPWLGTEQARYGAAGGAAGGGMEPPRRGPEPAAAAPEEGRSRAAAA